MVIMFMCIEKHLVSGLASGGVKGSLARGYSYLFGIEVIMMCLADTKAKINVGDAEWTDGHTPLCKD